MTHFEANRTLQDCCVKCRIRHMHKLHNTLSRLTMPTQLDIELTKQTFCLIQNRAPQGDKTSRCTNLKQRTRSLQKETNAVKACCNKNHKSKLTKLPFPSSAAQLPYVPTHGLPTGGTVKSWTSEHMDAATNSSYKYVLK